MKVIPTLIVFLAATVLGWFMLPRPDLNYDIPRTQLSTRSLEARQSTDDVARQLRAINKLTSYEEQVRQIIALASSVPIDEIAAWHKKGLTSISDPGLAELFNRITGERWLEVEPEKMMDWAIVMMEESQSNDYLAKWALRDPEMAVAFTLKVEGRMEGLIANLLKADPELAFEIAQEHMAVNPVGSWFTEYGLAQRLATHDLEATLAMRENWSPELRKQTNAGIVAAILRQDFAKGMKFLESENLQWDTLYSAIRQGEDLSSLYLKHARDLPPGWLEEMMKKSSEEWGQGLGDPGWLIADPETLGVSAETFAHYQKKASYYPGTGDPPPELMDIVNGDQLASEHRKNLLHQKILNWPAHDPEGLQAWLSDLQEESLFKAADKALAQREQRLHPAPIVPPAGRLQEIASGSPKDVFLGGYWTPDAIQEAQQTFQQFNPEEKANLYAKLTDDDSPIYYQVPAEFSATILAEIVNSHQAEGPNSPSELMDQMAPFAAFWANADPANAAQWVTSLPDGQAKLSAATEVAKVWAGYAPDEARAWVNQFPNAERDLILPK